MGNCCRTPKPRRTATQSLSVETDVLTISLKPLSYVISKAAVSPLPDPDLTSLSSGNNTARSHRRGRSDPEADEDCTPVDYFSGEDSRESLILTPLADPAPKLPPHPLVPPLNFTYLQPEKTTLNVDQVQAKRNKWSKERQRGRLLLEISKSPEPENPPNLSSISSSKESIPRPKNLLPMAQNSVRAIRSMETTPKPKPRICLPKIPLVMPILHTRRTEDLAMSALTGTTLDEKSDVKNVELMPIAMSQIAGRPAFQVKALLRPLVDRQSPQGFPAIQQRLHARHTSLSIIKSSTKLLLPNETKTTASVYQERTTPVKMTSKMVKTRKPDGTIEINDYQLIKEVGSGAFGRVYAARKGDHHFAIKEYNKQKLKHVLIGKRKTALDSVKEEVAILSRIEHPNIIYLYEVIDSPESRKTYLVMEYAEQGRLQDCLPLTESRAQMYFGQMVEAVEYLHEVVRVIHRDIKPDNVLLDKEGNIKVSDFGSSQAMRNPDDTFTNTPGTPAFLSPEQCGGTKEFLGKPLDIWAMGVTLYYMLYNRPPFIARRLGDLYESIKSEEVNLPHECSKELKDLILRLLEKNPIRRIQLQEVKDHPWLRSRQINQSYA